MSMNLKGQSLVDRDERDESSDGKSCECDNRDEQAVLPTRYLEGWPAAVNPDESSYGIGYESDESQ